MNKYKLIICILNLLGGVLLALYVYKAFYWMSFALRDISNIHLAIGFGLLFAIKSFIELKFKVTDPMKDSKLTNTLFLAGFGFLTFGIIFRVVAGPLSFPLLLIGASLMILSYIIALISLLQFSEQTNDILDDFE